MKKITLFTLLSSSFLILACGGGDNNPNINKNPSNTPSETSYQSDNSSSIIDILNNPKPFNNAPAIPQTEIDNYLKAINDARAQGRKCGDIYYDPAPQVTWNEKLYKAAAEHNYDLANTTKDKFFSHTGSATDTDWTYKEQNLTEGSTPAQRVANNGYNYTIMGENIVGGYVDRDPNKPIDTAKKAVDEWLKSPGHCANLMNPDYEEVGMAYTHKENSYLEHYWTQVFGKSSN